MDITLDLKNRLIITPETEFEKSYIEKLDTKEFIALIKVGMSSNDIAGLILTELPTPNKNINEFDATIICITRSGNSAEIKVNVQNADCFALDLNDTVRISVQ